MELKVIIDDTHFQRLVLGGYTRPQLSRLLKVANWTITLRARKLGVLEQLEQNRKAPRIKPPTFAEVKYGMPKSEIKELQKKGVMDAYRRQRQNARNRGIPWNLDLKQWWEIWRSSGKWEQRGRTLGGWVMGRVADAGAYVAGNVYICSHSENAQVRSDNIVARTGKSQFAKKIDRVLTHAE